MSVSSIAALKGIEFSHAISGPRGAMILTDSGRGVLISEKREGDISSGFKWLARS
jgi:hypothetical protein